MHDRSLTAHRGTILAALVALLPLAWHPGLASRATTWQFEAPGTTPPARFRRPWRSRACRSPSS
jgi:hypothetical protein